jgi:hypothetical protein
MAGIEILFNPFPDDNPPWQAFTEMINLRTVISNKLLHNMIKYNINEDGGNK